MDMDAVLSKARAWAAADPDPAARAEIEALLAAADPSTTDLADRFAGELEFGTAGLRGVIGAGPNRMNRAVVLRTTWGLAQHVKESFGDNGAKAGVVIGFDGRRMSRELAEDTACALAAAGIKAHLFDDVVPTPMLAFAVKKLGTAAGVMITASHNPPEYNGYKAYWNNGAQIVPPTDVAIAAQIGKAPPAKDVPRLDFEEAKKAGKVTMIGEELDREYLGEVKKLGPRPGEGDRTLSIVYTPMHGVGDKLTRLAFDDAGFTNVVSVPEQQKPDGAFPTVAFPNPEEKGAMDLSFALARAKKADLVLANDPDADRLAVALPRGDGFVQLTGNQVGVLLGHYMLTGGLASLDQAVGSAPLVIVSIVSSPMLGVIAQKLGAKYDEVLTGFKWIANRAMERKSKSGDNFVFGFEEALGYTVGELVRDKDGVSAAVVFAELTAVLKSKGTTVLDHLEGLYRRYGLFVSSQVNVTRKGVEGVKELKAIMAKLRAAPPMKIGDHDVVAVRDYLTHTITKADGSTTTLDLPKSDVLTWDLASGSRVIARPSGTEPKAKFYFDVREPIKEGEPLADAERRAADAMKKLSEAFTAIALGS
ncbi:MAG: phospho-sugar mutase [Labilithrix sp.]